MFVVKNYTVIIVSSAETPSITAVIANKTTKNPIPLFNLLQYLKN